VAPAFEPNRSDITDGFLRVTKSGANATAEWGSITGDITTQTDLIDTFLARTNTDVYTPSALYHPATKKYVDDQASNYATAAQGSTAGSALQPTDFTSTSVEIDAATDDVQQAIAASLTDTAAGRLLKVGDFGVGSTTSVSQPSDFNGINFNSFFRGNNTAANSPPIPNNFNVLNLAASADTNTQIAMNWTNVNPQMFFRSQTVAGYSPWQEILHTGNTQIQPNATDLELSPGAGLLVGGTGAANRLSIYEEGTFTATLKDAGNTGAALTMTEQQYTRIGRLVIIHMSGFLSVNLDTVGDWFEIQGLPYTAKVLGSNWSPFVGVMRTDRSPSNNSQGHGTAHVFEGSDFVHLCLTDLPAGTPSGQNNFVTTFSYIV
jgi:hypothetical protein